MAMLGLSVNAQSWTASSVPSEASEFVLFNVGKGYVFTKGNAWGTQASMTSVVGDAIQVTLDPEGDYYVINTKVGNDAWGLEQLGGADNVYTDQSRDKKSTWEFVEVSTNAFGPIYKIIAKDNHNGGGGGYLAAHAENTVLTGNDDGSTDYAQWQLVAPDQVEALGSYINMLMYGARYNAVKAAVLAVNSEIDLTAADAIAGGATDEEGFNEAVSAARSALAAYLPSSEEAVDITDAIIDNAAPGVSGNMNYWVNSQTPSLEKQLWEFWNKKGETSTQTLTTTLPAGWYILKAIAYTREGMDGVIFAGSDEQTIVGVSPSEVNVRSQGDAWIAKGNGVNNLIFRLFVDTPDLPIGIRASGDNTDLENNDGWTCWRSFQLIYAKDLATIYNQPLKEAVDEANSIAEGTIPAAAYTALQAVVTENNKAWESASEFENAIQAIKDETAKAKALVSAYAIYVEKADAIKAMKDEDVYTGADAKSTLESALSTSKTEIDKATTLETIEAEMVKIIAAAKTFVKNIKLNADARLDLTCLIENPHFYYGTTASPTGWKIESGSLTELRTLTHNFETYHKQFNLSQTITDLPKGTYKVTLQGFARHDGSATDKTTLYCGIKSVAVKDIKAEWSTTSFFNNDSQAMGDTNKDLSYEKDGVGTVYQPNGMTSAYYWFQETNPVTSQPFYTSEVETLITEDGDLKIGFMCETTTDWVIWDNFHLYYYGTAIAVTLDEAEGSSYSEDIVDANVTLKKTIAEGWNTVVLPIEVAKEDIGATELYSYTGDDPSGVLQFATATKIEPNVPYLMKAAAASSEAKKFTGVTVKAATDLTAAGDAFNFVGTYTGTTATENDYLLTATAFAKAKGGNTIKAYRAFIQKKAAEPEARELKISIDGVITGIEAIDGKAVNSNAAIYNLAGQKVKNAQRGLYIQNGKKYIVK